MLANKILFKKEKTELNRLNNLAVQVGELLSDINEFPIHLLNYTGPSTDAKCEEIYEKLSKMSGLYSKALSAFGFQDFMQYLAKNKSPILFFAERNGKVSKNNLINQLMIYSISEKYINVDDYVLHTKPNKVFNTIKGLQTDSDGLVPINKKFDLRKDGIFFDKKYLIYYHPFLRRFFTSNFTETTVLLTKLSKRNDLKLKINIDPYRLASPNHYRGDIMEFDFWRGPKFSKAKLNDRNYVGKIVYGRSIQPVIDTWPIIKTDFYVSNRKDGTKQIEIEEVNPTSKMEYSKKFIIQKYIHTIWDLKTEKFTHFDTAVKVYEKKSHPFRLLRHWKDKNVNAKEVKPRKIKLYRIDGGLSIDETMGLIGDFFRYNELIKEFFDGK